MRKPRPAVPQVTSAKGGRVVRYPDGLRTDYVLDRADITIAVEHETP